MQRSKQYTTTDPLLPERIPTLLHPYDICRSALSRILVYDIVLLLVAYRKLDDPLLWVDQQFRHRVHRLVR